MKIAIKGGKVYRDGVLKENDVLVIDENAGSAPHEFSGNDFDFERVISLDNSFLLPSFCDVHVHFREPGQSEKETIKTGSLAAARGGYTTVCTMPNLSPAPADLCKLDVQRRLIERDALIRVIPYGTITREQNGRGVLSEMEAMAELVAAFSDDGRGVQADALMREAMLRAKACGKLIVAHCEDEALLRQGKVRESEWKQIERDLRLADETGVGYHVCHISCKESVEVIREAKKSGVDVTCETAPHYLVLDDDVVAERIAAAPALGGRYKMNPPIKGRSDREALLEGVLDGTVDMIATDHAPHTEDEKARGFAKSPDGITGLECAFPVLYTELVNKGILSLAQLVELMAIKPRRRFGIEEQGSWTIIDPETPFVLDSRRFASLGKCTPFDGMTLVGKVKMTIASGKIVYDAQEEENAGRA